MELLALLVCFLFSSPGVQSEAIEGLNVGPILAELQHCILNVVQITQPIDYRPITVPYALWVFPIHKNYSSIYVPVAPNLLKLRRAFKLREQECQAHIVLAGIHKSFDEEENLPENLLIVEQGLQFKASYILKWIKNIFGTYSKLSTLVIIFRQNAVKNDFSKYLVRTIRETSEDVPVFTLFPGRVESHCSLSGYYHHGIRYRGRYEKLCCHSKACLSTLWSTFNRVSNHGKKVLWTIRIGHHELYHGKEEKLDSLQGIEPGRLIEAAYKFLIGDMDVNISKTGYYYFATPYIHLKPSSVHGYNTYMATKISSELEFPVSYTLPKNFITSEGVYALRLEYALYTSPFDLSTWICLALSIFMLAPIMSSQVISPWEGQTVVKVARTALSFLGSFVDQGMETPRPGFFKSGSQGVMLSVWLLTVIVLSNGYKGCLKTSFITGKEYRTKWTNLEELKGFTLYFPVGVRYDYRGVRGVGIAGGFCNTTASNCERGCLYNNHAKEGFVECYDRKESMVYYKKFEKAVIGQRFQPFCIEQLQSIIETNLTKPRTALVFPSTELDYYWDVTRRTMREKNLRFAHNRHNMTHDQLFRNPTSLIVGRVFDERYQHVARRVQTMLSAGLYLFWERWDLLKYPNCFSHYRKNGDNDISVKALSMESSLILALKAFLWSLVACGIVFGGEILFRFSTSKKQ